MRNRVLYQYAIVFCALLASCSFFDPLSKYPARLEGLASQYIGDVGVQSDPQVIFSDNFENWNCESCPPENTWDVHLNTSGRARIVPSSIIPSNGGDSALEVSCWSDPGDQTAGLTLKLGNYVDVDEELGDGYEDIYLRYYIKFDHDYKILNNHGINLGGRDLSHPNPSWVGMANVRRIEEAGYFFSGLQPAGLKGDQSIELDIYSYHIDKPGRFGEVFRQQRSVKMEVGKWYCIERHLRLNSVDLDSNVVKSDGLEEVWVDGLLVTRIEGIRYRITPKLRITYLGLETYYHGLPSEYSEENPIKVYFDNVVIAKSYIGPVQE